MAAAKCRNRRRELTDTLQAVSAAREAGGRGARGRGGVGWQEEGDSSRGGDAGPG